MNIGQVAEATGLTAKAIRHYESQGLVVPERQLGNQYRRYSLQDVDHLRFLQRARAVGFSLEDARQLLDVYRNPNRNSAEVHALVKKKLSTLDQQWLAVNVMRDTLMNMAAQSLTQENSAGAINPSKSDMPLSKTMPFTLIEVPHE